MVVSAFGFDIRMSASFATSPQAISSGQIAQNTFGACSKSLAGEVKRMAVSLHLLGLVGYRGHGAGRSSTLVRRSALYDTSAGGDNDRTC